MNKSTSPLAAAVAVLVQLLAWSAHAQIPTQGLTLWLKADADVTRDASGWVSAWQDQSSRSNHLAQADANRRPLWTNNVLNGLPVLQFRDDWLSRAAVPGTNLFANTAATVFIVQKQLGSDQRTTTISWRTGSDHRWMVHATYDDSIAFQLGQPGAGGQIVCTQPPGWDDTWHVLTVSRDGTNGDIRVDGVGLIDPRTTYFRADGDSSQIADLHIGNDIWGNTFNGDIAEIIAYNTALSATDRTMVESYLRTKWGLPTAPTAIPDLLIKAASEPDAAYAANAVYQLSPAGSQIKTQAVGALQSATFHVKVENDAAHTKAVTLKATENVASGWSVTYRLGSSNITPMIITTAGFTTTNLPPGGSLVLSIEVTMTGVVTPGTAKTVTVSAYDDYVPGLVRDAVQAMAVAAAGVQPDLMARRDIDPSPVGDNIYNTTGVSQTLWQDVLTNQTASYAVTLANDGNTNCHLKLVGPAGGAGWTVGYWDYLLQFDGGDDVVDTGAWSPGTNWTVEAWVFPTSTPGGRRIIAGGMADCHDWAIAMHDGQFAVEVRQPGGCTIAYRSGVPVVATNWYHVAATCDGTNASLYVNGALVATGAVEPNYVATAGGTRIGSAVCCSGDSFPGLIREVRIWSRPLGSNEITSLMSQTLTGTEAGLQGYWRLDDGPLGVVRDLGPFRRHGTVWNGAVWQRRDVTAQVTGAGLAAVLLAPGGSKVFLVEVTPDSTVANGASKEVLLTATALADLTKQDAVKLVTKANRPGTVPVNALFTSTADFGKGWMSGVEAWSVPDQLQLSRVSGVLPFLWVPNSGDGTVSKVDTLTGNELGRYRVCPPGVGGNPSRTTVDLRGNCWVANRNCSTAVKIGLLEHGEYADRNGDGVIQTSRDLNGDGVISGSELLDWGQDECVLHEVFLTPGHETNYVPGRYLGSYVNNYWNPGLRGMAVDAQGNLWAGTHDTMKYFYIDGSSGRILRSIDVSAGNHTAYGAVIDQQGLLWSSGYKESGQQNLLRLNPADGSFTAIALDFHSYGLALDRNNHLFVSAHQEALLTRWNVLTGAREWTVSVGGNNRGVAVTDDGDVWVVSSSQRTVTRFSNDGIQKAAIAVGPTPTGVAVDAAGKVWVCGTGDEYLRRIDPATDSIDLVKRIASSHYGYSDMTGILVRNSTVRLGIWSVVHDAQIPNTAWTLVQWHGSDPTGTNILVRIRSSNDRASWSAWETAVNGAAPRATPPGRYLEFEVTLRSVPGVAEPVLQDISATGAAPGPADLGVLLSGTPNPVLSEYAQTYSVTVTNAGTNWASGVVVSNLLSTNVDVVSVTVPGGFYQRTGNVFVCTLGGVGPRSAVTITFTTFPLRPGTFTNTASVSANETDSNPANNAASLAVTAQVVPCTPPPVGFVAWWPGEGDASSRVGTNHGQLQGTVTFLPGKVGTAFTFDGNDDRVVIPHEDRLNPSRSGFTVQFWMKGGKNQPGQSDSLVCLAEKSHGWADNTGWSFQAYPANGVLSFGCGYGWGTGSGFLGADSLVGVLDDRWHFIAGTWDGFTLRLYVDGLLQRETPLLIPATNGRPVNLGFTWGNGSPRRFFRGQLDEVAIHDRALGESEIAAIYAARSGGWCTGTPVINRPTGFADAVVGRDFAQTVSAMLGTPPYTYAVASGTLPPGLALAANGLLSGRPTGAGTFVFTIRATDAASGTAQRTFTNRVFACTPRPEGLIGWWTADDGTDDLAGTNHGTLEYDAGYDTGRVGRAFVLDGQDDAIRLFGSSQSALRITTNRLTVDAWVNSNATNPPPTGYAIIYDKAWDGSPNGYELAVVMGDLLFWLATTDAPQGFSLSYPLPRQRWVHVAGTYDGSMARLYLDGVEVAAAPLTGNILPNNHDACIGSDNWPGSRDYAFNGLIDEVHVFNRGLSAAEVQALYAAGAAGLCPVLYADLLVKKASEPDTAYALDNAYQSVPETSQTKSQSVLPLNTVSFQVKVQNDGPTARTFALEAVESAEQDWTVVYRAGASDVSFAMRSSQGYMTPTLAPGASHIITVDMRPGLSVPAGTNKTVTVNAYLDGGASTVRDAVKLIATCAPTYQPDLMIRRDMDGSFTGEGFFNATGEGQTKLLEVAAGQTATYHVQLKNYGNSTNRIRLNGTAGSGGWTVNYCGPRTVLRFDNTDDYVSISNSPALHSDRQLTVSGWFKSDGFTKQWQNVFWKGNPGDCTYNCENREYSLWLNNQGYLHFTSTPSNRVGVGQITVETPSGIIQPGRWYHFACVLNSDSNYMRVFVNGELKAQAAYSTNGIRTTDGPLHFGSELPVRGNTFYGSLQHVSIWRRAMESNEVAMLMVQNPLGNEPDLMGYWPLHEGGGVLVRDLSAYHNDGQLQNGPVWAFDYPPAGDCFDLAPAMSSSAGWTNIVLAPKASYDLQIQVTPGLGVPAGAVQELTLTATSMEDATSVDVVKAITIALTPSATPQGGTYTSNLDFERGRLSGVEHTTVPDQLRLTTNSATLPYLWVPNNEGTISKLDTLTGRELARYRTCPSNVNGKPSRTTVDLLGNCWVGNRYAGTVVKVGLLESGQYVDRNGNGIIETSRDTNGDGDITGDELLPWGQDECVLFEVSLIPGYEGTFTPGTFTGPYQNSWGYPGPRGFAVDATGNCWVGTFDTKKFYYLDGATGAILRTIDVSSVNHTSYGAVMDRHGILWSSSSDKQHVLRLNPATGAFDTIPLGHHVYGINVDRNDHLFVSGWEASKLSRVNILTATKDWTVPGVYQSRGVAVTDDGDVWVANSGPGTVTRWSPDGVVKATIPAGNQPTGVAVDSRGMVWVVGLGDEYARRIDPTRNVVDLTKRILCANSAGYHYGYSDMTGVVARNSTTRIGFWTVVHNAKVRNTPWGVVSWHALVPEGTTLTVRARSSNDQQTWSLWETVQNGAALRTTPPGQFLEVEVALQSALPDLSPILYDLSVQPAQQASSGLLVYTNGFDAPVGGEWSTNTVSTSPVGARRYLGNFGNQTVSLALSNLPPHAAVTVTFDQFVLGTWDGNDTNDGPDRWELNVGGGLKLLDTTFNNAPANSAAAGQSFPDNYPGGSWPARTAAAETNSLGFAVPGVGVMDTVYRHTYNFPHTADWLVLNFQAAGLVDNLASESWGLDNVCVYLTPSQGPPELFPVGRDATGFSFAIQADPGWNYVIQASSNLIQWTSLWTNRPATNRVYYVDPAATSLPRRFYRVLQLP